MEPISSGDGCSRVLLDPVDHRIDVGDDHGPGVVRAVVGRGTAQGHAVQHPVLYERVAEVALEVKQDYG